MSFPEAIERGVELPDGARYLRCALQVKPWAYIERERKATSYDDEVAYHTALIDACVASGIGAIAVTDHHAVLTSAPLLHLARDHGLVAFSTGHASGMPLSSPRTSGSRSSRQGGCRTV